VRFIFHISFSISHFPFFSVLPPRSLRLCGDEFLDLLITKAQRTPRLNREKWKMKNGK